MFALFLMNSGTFLSNFFRKHKEIPYRNHPELVIRLNSFSVRYLIVIL